MGIANVAALIACALAMGLGALGAGLGLGNVARASLRSMARQPAKDPEFFRYMLVGQAITETPAIFALVVSFLLYFAGGRALEAPNSPAQSLMFLSAGLCMGIGALGSGIGSGLVAKEALEGMSRYPSSQGQLAILMMIGQAWTQTGGIFALVISLFMLNGGGFNQLSGANDPLLWGSIPISAGEILGIARFAGAGIAMGFGAVGSSVGIAYIGCSACRSLADVPEAGQRIKSAYFIGSATAQSPSVFALIIALILLIRG
ncbi:MAG: ATP synthase F0 subunit C [Planctomycetota bacterium]|jgi:F0F1-type ATP synthase membrane subunit c/vacuolar-type H+-ATPase subunit K|nr:ATP synthase F0 subunit C [Planctomycetota bacterium]